MAEKVTYSDTSSDLQYLVSLGVPLVDIAARMGRSTEAVYAMLYPGKKIPDDYMNTQEKR